MFDLKGFLKFVLTIAAIIVAITLAIIATGTPPPKATLMLNSDTVTDEIKVTRIGVFEDDLAYGNRRGVYRIYDLKSGKEYLGVSGIGITETSEHNEGKKVVSDER